MRHSSADPRRGAMVMGVAMAGVTMGVVVMTVRRVGLSGIGHGAGTKKYACGWAQCSPQLMNHCGVRECNPAYPGRSARAAEP